MPKARVTDSLPSDVTPPLAWVPTRVFMVSGVGVHEHERVALQHAMRSAGVADCNLLKVSSVIAPGVRIISAEEGMRLLRPGNIVTAVIATAQTDQPHQRVAPALAWAKPEKAGVPGYIAEIEEEMAKGKSEATATKQVGEEVLELLAMRMRVKIDPERLWEKRGRERVVRMGGTRVHVGALCASTVGPEERDGKKLTAAAFVAAIYI
jgi:arginine decarboxylase